MWIIENSAILTGAMMRMLLLIALSDYTVDISSKTELQFS